MSQNIEHHRQFALHYEDNKHKLFTYLNYRLSFNEALAEDLMMDIVLKAYENFEKFDPEKGNFQQWLFTIAGNHLKNHWRGLKKQTVSLEKLQEGGFDIPSELGLNDTAKGIEKENVLRTLDALKPDEKDIIVMKYINDFSYEEIAGITGKREGAIRTQLSRALKRFKKIYQKIYSE